VGLYLQAPQPLDLLYKLLVVCTVVPCRGDMQRLWMCCSVSQCHPGGCYAEKAGFNTSAVLHW
jgi:hypothetical protein